MDANLATNRARTHCACF